MNLKSFLVTTCAFISTSVFAETLTLNSMDKDSMASLLKGSTMVVGPGVYIKDKYVPGTVKITYGSDGTLKGTLLSPNDADSSNDSSKTDTGTWTLKENGVLCNSWKNWGDFCQYIYPLKTHYIIVTTDQAKVVVMPKDKITHGNS